MYWSIKIKKRIVNRCFYHWFYIKQDVCFVFIILAEGESIIDIYRKSTYISDHHQ